MFLPRSRSFGIRHPIKDLPESRVSGLEVTKGKRTDQRMVLAQDRDSANTSTSPSPAYNPSNVGTHREPMP